MSDHSKKSLPTYYTPPPAPAQRSPAHGSVNLPAGNAWFGRTTTVLRKNAAQVRAHADYLDARKEQASNARALVDVRIELARSIARLDWLPEVLEADYRRGVEDMRHEYEMLSISHATTETHARAQLVAARNYLASLQPQPPPPSSPAPAAQPAALTPNEVDELLAALPDLSAETRKTISYILNARAAEKQRS